MMLIPASFASQELRPARTHMLREVPDCSQLRHCLEVLIHTASLSEAILGPLGRFSSWFLLNNHFAPGCNPQSQQYLHYFQRH